MLIQEFDCEIQDRKDTANNIVNRLSRIVINDVFETPICECLLMNNFLGLNWSRGRLILLITWPHKKCLGNTKDDGACFLALVRYFI